MKARNYIFHFNDDRPGIWLEGNKDDGKMRVLFVYRSNGTAAPIQLNEWIDVAATWDGNEFVGYINGKPVSKVSLPKFIKGNRVTIGWDGGTDRHFEGDIHEVKIYQKALTFFCSDVSEIPFAQCQTLMDLYESSNGENWTNNEGWNVGNTPCSWYGVECTDGNITNISLETNNLSGTISNSLNGLTGLETLVIGNNQGITGNFSDISQLSNLYHISIGNTNINGTLPANIIIATSLRKLGVSETQLGGELPDFNQLYFKP